MKIGTKCIVGLVFAVVVAHSCLSVIGSDLRWISLCVAPGAIIGLIGAVLVGCTAGIKENLKAKLQAGAILVATVLFNALVEWSTADCFVTLYVDNTESLAYVLTTPVLIFNLSYALVFVVTLFSEYSSNDKDSCWKVRFHSARESASDILLSLFAAASLGWIIFSFAFLLGWHVHFPPTKMYLALGILSVVFRCSVDTETRKLFSTLIAIAALVIPIILLANSHWHSQIGASGRQFAIGLIVGGLCSLPILWRNSKSDIVEWASIALMFGLGIQMYLRYMNMAMPEGTSMFFLALVIPVILQLLLRPKHG